jgi:hypothetical protein
LLVGGFFVFELEALAPEEVFTGRDAGLRTQSATEELGGIEVTGVAIEGGAELIGGFGEGPAQKKCQAEVEVIGGVFVIAFEGATEIFDSLWHVEAKLGEAEVIEDFAQGNFAADALEGGLCGFEIFEAEFGQAE